ncbi:type ISP restriction/modification enzyme [Methylocystis heyeri]|uniref:type ISP restriction/modification enzyme n=1 Tax=Methylocystis heyeri TaxID=391905 RepID=UPI001FE95BA8|nr:type ISP restriction/modification enzyme [Methylocystis heyeri]
MTSSHSVSNAISTFGASCKAKLANKAAAGAPEDQLRAPLEALFEDLTSLIGLPEKTVSLVGESTLSALATRPDYAVTVQNALVGFIEVKAPGKGADPRRFTDEHDKKQWMKLKSLPNLLYTDGNAFSLWRNGELIDKLVMLEGDVGSSGAKLAAPASFLPLISDFLIWSPTPPRSVPQLAQTTARLCRLLRDEVTEELEAKNPGLTSLATEWRGLLFPQATDAEFADGYAQAVTFGLLVARARDIELKDGIDKAALALKKTNSLIGTALRLLTDSSEVQQALDSALRTLARVLDAVHWPTLTKGAADAWLYFYEDFLAVYDNALRKRTGSYYTPPEVVAAMVRLVDEALREPALFGLPQGLASHDVTLADPAVGTGAYLLGALQKIAQTVENDLGPGAVPGAVAAAVNRLIGFEMQFGPFAVAQLRLMAEIQTLMSVKDGDGGNLPALRLFITDTLGDPYATQTQFSSLTAPIGESRKQANDIKRNEKITVVIGNPPYKEKAKGRGGWIEQGSAGRPSAMDSWSPPPAWGVSAHAKHLKNLYVYFWRWATWKVFGSGHAETTGEPEPSRSGIVCFITVAGFLNGPGFQKMRDDLRRDCSDIWVIDCSPEGHQPEVPTRIFQGVQQPVCIVLAVRPPGKDRTQPARLHFRALPEGKREEKFKTLAEMSVAGAGWAAGPNGWRDPFLSQSQGLWADFLPLKAIFGFESSGVLCGRTWVIAPDAESLKTRWDKLIGEKDPACKETLFHPTLRHGELADRHTNKVVKDGLNGHEKRETTVANDKGPVIKPTRYAWRTFDLQWIIPDNRLILSARLPLWNSVSKKQVFATALDASSPVSGPALSFAAIVPDQDHYKGSFGGRVFPLWRDAAATVPNIRPELILHFATAYGFQVGAEDVMAYIAALLAHPAFTRRFQSDLIRPGLRVPLTADAALFSEAVKLGKEVVWLHCYGERFSDPKAGRPAGPPRLPKGEGPVIPAGGGIPGAPEALPNTMEYDPATRRLRIGAGVIDNVPQTVWDYEVSGKNVLRQWFSYRKLDRSRPIIGDRRPPSPLDKIQPDHWLDEYTTDLMNLLHVLGRLVKIEPAQEGLLERVCAAPLLPPP